jgi:hypothetical protein
MQATADPLPIDLALQRSPLDRMMGRWTLDTSPNQASKFGSLGTG